MTPEELAELRYLDGIAFGVLDRWFYDDAGHPCPVEEVYEMSTQQHPDGAAVPVIYSSAERS